MELGVLRFTYMYYNKIYTYTCMSLTLLEHPNYGSQFQPHSTAFNLYALACRFWSVGLSGFRVQDLRFRGRV